MSPYRSKRQRSYLHIHEPEAAAEWDKRYGGKVVKKKSKPRRKKER
jgi:hypothetical protein